MEVGDSTQSRAPALFEPQKIFWQASEWHPDYPKFYAAMALLRREHPALQQGQLVWVHNSDEQHVLTYIRRAQSERFLVAVNLSNTPFRGSVEANTGSWKEILLPAGEPAQTVWPAITLGAFKFRIFEQRAP